MTTTITRHDTARRFHQSAVKRVKTLRNDAMAYARHIISELEAGHAPSAGELPVTLGALREAERDVDMWMTFIDATR